MAGSSPKLDRAARAETVAAVDDGWFLAEEIDLSAVEKPKASSPISAPASGRAVGGDVDDGWVLPPELEATLELAPPSADPPRLDLNAAGLDALCTLPGIGRLRACRILGLRRERGRFESVEDLLAVKGVGRKTLAQLADRVCVARGAKTHS